MDVPFLQNIDGHYKQLKNWCLHKRSDIPSDSIEGGVWYNETSKRIGVDVGSEKKELAYVGEGHNSLLDKDGGDTVLNYYGHVKQIHNTILENFGNASGVIVSDANNYIPLEQIPVGLLGGLTPKGAWNPATNTPTLSNPPLATTRGWFYIASTSGTALGTDWASTDWCISDGTVWQKIDNTDKVSSVFGRTGNVVAASGDYNLDQVNDGTTYKRITSTEKTNYNTAYTHSQTTGNAHSVSASQIPCAATGDVSATNVQAAIAELASEKLAATVAGSTYAPISTTLDANEGSATPPTTTLGTLVSKIQALRDNVVYAVARLFLDPVNSTYSKVQLSESTLAGGYYSLCAPGHNRLNVMSRKDSALCGLFNETTLRWLLLGEVDKILVQTPTEKTSFIVEDGSNSNRKIVITPYDDVYNKIASTKGDGAQSSILFDANAIAIDKGARIDGNIASHIFRIRGGSAEDGFEVHTNEATLTLLAYNRSIATYRPMQISASSLNLELNEMPVTVTTAAASDSSKKVANTEWVKSVATPINATLTNESGQDVLPTGTYAITAILQWFRNNLSQLFTAVAGKAPTSHASTAMTYGVGSATNYGHAMASSATPLMNGTASAGTDNGKYAREGHVHPTDTSKFGYAGGFTASPKIWKGTHTQYNALGSWDSNTIYLCYV